MQTRTIKAITDKEGLNRATATAEKLYVNGDTMYVAGTSNSKTSGTILRYPSVEPQRLRGIKTPTLFLARILRFRIWWAIHLEAPPF